MKAIVILFALVALGSGAHIRKIIRAPQQPIRIEVEPEALSEARLVNPEELPEEETPVVKPVPILAPRQTPVVKAAPIPAPRHRLTPVLSQKELEEEALREVENEKFAQQQNKNAKYSFASAVDDGIMDHSHLREESREGNKVTGSYSYSDGYVKRTVKYVADENGYRVVSEESEEIGDGPNVDMKNGRADVLTNFEGVETKYSINSDDYARHESTTEGPEQELKVQNNGATGGRKLSKSQ